MQGNNKILKAAWLFPDILFLHGERGNIMALRRIAGFAGIDMEVDKIDFSTENFNPMEYGIIFCPPGEMAVFPEVIDWLRPHKEALEEFVNSGRTLLVTGTSQCIFGGKTEREDGSVIEGLKIIDCDYKERKYVYGDDICFSANYGNCGEECFGVQVQMMDVESREEKSLGRLIYGFGNCGRDRNEGVVKSNSIFTNVLGPMLVLNPWLTKEIIQKAAAAAEVEIEDFDFDMTLEKKSLESKKRFALSKKTKLTNCI